MQLYTSLASRRENKWFLKIYFDKFSKLYGQSGSIGPVQEKKETLVWWRGQVSGCVRSPEFSIKMNGKPRVRVRASKSKTRRSTFSFFIHIFWGCYYDFEYASW